MPSRAEHYREAERLAANVSHAVDHLDELEKAGRKVNPETHKAVFDVLNFSVARAQLHVALASVPLLPDDYSE